VIFRPFISAFFLTILSGAGMPVLLAQHRTAAKDAESLAAAMKAEDEGHLHEAESILASLAAKYPESFEISASLGEIYAEEGNYAQAAPLLEKAVKLRPSSAPVLANLGAVYLKLDRNEDAVRVLRRAALLDPKNPATQSNYGLALMQMKHPAEAAKAFATAASVKAPDDDLLYNWSLALYDSGQYDEAGKVLSRATNLGTSAAAQSLMGDICEKQKNYKDAGEHYVAAVKLDPSEQNIYTAGIEFLRHWTFDPAIQYFQFGVKHYPASKRMLLALGIAHYSNNEFAKAAPIFAQLLNSDPDDEFVASLLGHDCSLMPDDSPGCSSLVDFAQRHTKNAPVATYAAASILHRPSDQQDLALANQLLQQAIAADPKFPESYYQLGVLEQQKKDWQASLAPLQRAIALRPAYSQAHYRLALAYSHTGQHEKAQAEIGLQQKYSQQEKDDLNARFKQVTTFLVSKN
jgi:tetratricopeptide (TPR) repeat protein